MNRRLRSRLLRIGRAAGGRSESGGIRFFALALAGLCLTLSLASVIAAYSAESARDARMSEGQMIPAGDSAPPESTTSVRFVIDHLRDGRQYSVVYIAPGGEGAPLPPGLDEWPEPGTAVLSPELLREGADQGIDGRYGPAAGAIDESGLADATELLAYVRPSHDMSQDDQATAVAAFGGPPLGAVIPFQNPHWLLDNQDFFDRTLPSLLVVLGVAPSILLTLVASGVASHSRDRRDALITALGGRVRHRLWVSLGEARVPVALGVVAALAVIAWFAAADRRLPLADYVVYAADVRGLWWAFGLGAAAAAAFVLSAAVLRSVTAQSALSGNRPLRAFGERTRKARVVLFLCFVFMAAFAADQFGSHSPLRTLAAYAGMIGTVLTMPTAIGAGIQAAGRALARLGNHRRESALLAAGRRMAHHPETIARQVFGVGACIFFLLFALVWQGNFASTAAQADTYIDERGYSLMEVHPRGEATAAQVDALASTVPDGIEVVAYTIASVEGRPFGGPIGLVGSCPALAALELPCPEPGREEPVEAVEGRFAAWLRSTTDGDLTVAEGAPSAALDQGSIALLAFTADGGDIEAGVLANAGAVFPYGAATSVPGSSWRTGAEPSRQQAEWVTLVGGFGLAVLVLATGLGLAGEFLRFGRAIAPLSVLAGNRRIYWRASALISLLPLSAAVAGGFLIGYAEARPLVTTGVNLITPAMVGTSCAAAVAAGPLMWWWSAAAAVGSADRWRPGRGDD